MVHLDTLLGDHTIPGAIREELKNIAEIVDAVVASCTVYWK